MNKQQLVNAKERVSRIVSVLKTLEKQVGKTKDSKKVIKQMEDFLRCNLSSPSIVAKYMLVADSLKEYANVEHV